MSDHAEFNIFNEIDIFNDVDVDDNGDFIIHYGTPRHSGRYPWGSGAKYQRSLNFASMVQQLRKEGLSDEEIAKRLKVKNVPELKLRYSIARNENRASDRARAIALRDKGYGPSEIGRIMGRNESSIRKLLDDETAIRWEATKNASQVIKDSIESNGNGFVDIGAGVSNRLDISNERLKAAVVMLEDEGYVKHNVRIQQQGTGKFTNTIVLAKPDLTYGDVLRTISEKKDGLQPPLYYAEDGEMKKLEPPVSVDSSRIYIRYAEDGGDQKDGLIELRRGPEDISLHNAHYAQVRIAVDNSHYLKGMAMHSDNIPDGYDIVFNTSKKHIDNPGKLDVLKPLKDATQNVDGNPFGASIRVDDELILAQRHYIGADGKKHLSALNIVSEEGNWEKWNKNLASQFLSKQPLELAKRQLDFSVADKKQEYMDIMNLTNPVVKRKLLEDFANNCDSAAVHLKAAALPRQKSQVILPFTELKDNEIYAPNFDNGEKVVLIRYPHGGKFEIPELVVNNNVKSVKAVLGADIRDAVGINANVAKRLSGADFDGDTVVVIPNNSGAIKTQAPLAALKDFDPHEEYRGYEGMRVLPKKQVGKEMGKISNLITDMTLKGATDDELARAVKHSMVVIDAHKHKLDYKASEERNGIAALKEKYQNKGNGKYGGASTLISRAKADARIDERTKLYSLYEENEDGTKGRKLVDNGIWVDTGEKAWKPTNRTYEKVRKKEVIDKETGEVKTIVENQGIKKYQTKTTRMDIAKDARELLSSQTNPLQMELLYANYANAMKAMGNEARKSILATGKQKRSPSAAKAYAKEVSSLKIKLNTSMKNAPLERSAQALAGAWNKAIKNEHPDMDDDDIKKMKSDNLKRARHRVGAEKSNIDITPKEWEAIQAGAISDGMLMQILTRADMDKVREYATPRQQAGLSNSQKSLATSMLNSGYTRKEVADRLGVSTSTLSNYLD